MKRLYLEQQRVPLTNLTEAQQHDLRNNWPTQYLVTKVIGSVTPKIHSFLTETEAHGYCEDEAWHVEIS